ncbi:hypothetical protein B0H17DRAFT_1203287 [Mycena rosella]|uniref:Uncharacterized protein n=1 Tax=Mycena rosella TaxID=1033263 RepID=A0AAD7DC04_MYCRO|nr:hypothetical protein B0H17DRAFT_1203287 [Mycena rosella]
MAASVCLRASSVPVLPGGGTEIMIPMDSVRSPLKSAGVRDKIILDIPLLSIATRTTMLARPCSWRDSQTRRALVRLRYMQHKRVSEPLPVELASTAPTPTDAHHHILFIRSMHALKGACLCSPPDSLIITDSHRDRDPAGAAYDPRLHGHLLRTPWSVSTYLPCSRAWRGSAPPALVAGRRGRVRRGHDPARPSEAIAERTRSDLLRSTGSRGDADGGFNVDTGELVHRYGLRRGGLVLSVPRRKSKFPLRVELPSDSAQAHRLHGLEGRRGRLR